jgi:hypothetical protein
MNIQNPYKDVEHKVLSPEIVPSQHACNGGNIETSEELVSDLMLMLKSKNN